MRMTFLRFFIWASLLVVGPLPLLKAQELHFGVKGGMSLTRISEDFGLALSTVNEGKLGYVAGLSLQLAWEPYSLQTEVLFWQNGDRRQEINVVPGGLETDISDITTRYISVPVLFRYHFYEGLYGLIGLQASFLVDNEFQLTQITDSDTVETRGSLDNLKTFDLEVPFALGWEAPFGAFIELRYLIGLTDIADLEDERNTHFGFQLMLGYNL
ncbi:porin family protein [Pontibacter sp. G13]|uniref:porin family protein n=1 Tax=Pontibacter sp. G13 TaxID=3074898 RepID=UPI00288A435A|nr:porin family protein [Pontibacter sp. G13]WNJ19206.1 porin family protein [Pontibacter sp. G13]